MASILLRLSSHVQGRTNAALLVSLMLSLPIAELNERRERVVGVLEARDA